MPREIDPTNRATLTIPELCALFGTDRRSTYAMAHTGTLPVATFRAGRRIFASRAAVETLVGKEAVRDLLAREHRSSNADTCNF